MQNIQDIEIIIDRLVSVRNCVQTLQRLTIGNQDHLDQGMAQIQGELDRIWDESCLIHKQLCEERQILGYWEDAVEQATRVCEMILDFGDDPTHEQLLCLGMANELLGQRIKEYKIVATMAAQFELITGERHGLDRAAA